MPLARSSLLPVIIEFAEKSGVSAGDLLSEVDVDAALLSHPSTVIDSSVLIDAVGYAARASGQRDFGLKIATCDDVRALAPIGMIVDHCKTTTEALAATARHLRMHNSALIYELFADAHNITCRLTLEAHGKHPSAQYIEMCLGLCTRLCRLLMGDAWRPAFVCFEHDREADPAAYHRTFRAPVRFAQSMNAIVGRRADFDQPIDRDNPQVQDLLTALNEIRERERNEDIVVRLHPVLRPLLASGDASAARAAKLLGLSPRTLQRRLAERGTTFQRVLDDVRLNLVREHLPGKKLADLAPILGFSEPSAVSRFLRATGGFKHYKEGAGASAGD